MDMNKPIFPDPPGYIIDVDNPQRTGEAANFWIGTLGMIIAAIFMAIRVYTKTMLAKNFTPDDSKRFSSGRDEQSPNHYIELLTISTVALLIAWVRRIAA